MPHPEPGQIWQHFKGQPYYIVAVAEHSESHERLVIYTKGRGETNWARPLSMFMGPAKVKPTKPGEYNCYHSMQDHYIETAGKNVPPEWGVKPGEKVMFCRDCEDAADLGRFTLVSVPAYVEEPLPTFKDPSVSGLKEIFEAERQTEIER